MRMDVTDKVYLHHDFSEYPGESCWKRSNVSVGDRLPLQKNHPPFHAADELGEIPDKNQGWEIGRRFFLLGGVFPTLMFRKPPR